MRPIVLRIPGWTRQLLATLPRWKETPLAARTRIARHAHRFVAVYFAFGAKHLETEAGLRSLPLAAMVIVPAGIVHGWHGPAADATATIGHFHPGHPVHIIEPVLVQTFDIGGSV